MVLKLNVPNKNLGAWRFLVVVNCIQGYRTIEYLVNHLRFKNIDLWLWFHLRQSCFTITYPFIVIEITEYHYMFNASLARLFNNPPRLRVKFQTIWFTGSWDITTLKITLYLIKSYLAKICRGFLTAFNSHEKKYHTFR